jgi:hypothetical protein
MNANARWIRAAYWLTGPMIFIIVFWRAPFVWFATDDFAWLSFSRQVHGISDLGYVLFHPEAQGTVRVFSERLYFLVLSNIFGITVWPFRLVTLGTWLLNLALINLAGTKLTGSRLAGVLAALLWTVNSAIVTPVVWSSAYNQALLSFVVLGAFCARLMWLETNHRKWRCVEAALYLFGFGVLETVVMYPFLVMLHAVVDPRARARWREALWMFLPAAAFTGAHLFLIPKDPAEVYQLSMDSRLPVTLWKYIKLATVPNHIRFVGSSWKTPALVATYAALAVLTGWLFHRRNYLALFFCGWFFVFLAPILPLPNHVSDYYLTVPTIGLALLGGWAIVAAWRLRWPARALAGLLAAVFLWSSILSVDVYTEWNLRRTSRMRMAFRAAEAQVARYPGLAIAFTGVDEELFLLGFTDGAFRLLNTKAVWLAPGSDQLLSRPHLEQWQSFRTTPGDLLPLLETAQARVLDVSGIAARDITQDYTGMLRAKAGMVNVGIPGHAPFLGTGWYGIENGGRWMGKQATLTIAHPNGSTMLHVTGYAPVSALAVGPLTVRFRLNGRGAGSLVVNQPDSPFDGTLPLPADLPPGNIEITVECSRTIRLPGDDRELGIVFGTFRLR